MIDKICIMVPTYKRVAGLRRLIESAKQTAKGNICFGFCVNAKDEQTKEYLSTLAGVEYYVVEETTTQPNLAMYWNMLFDACEWKDRCAVSMIGDDMEFVTPGWDLRILNTLNTHDGMRIVYCNDNFVAGEKLCVNLFTTKAIVDATEKPFMCPFYHADMIDVVWQWAGEATGTLSYLGDVIIKHHHFSSLPKEAWDETANRLVPIQKIYHTDPQRQIAAIYATMVAANMIKNGVGKWNTL